MRDLPTFYTKIKKEVIDKMYKAWEIFKETEDVGDMVVFEARHCDPHYMFEFTMRLGHVVNTHAISHYVADQGDFENMILYMIRSSYKELAYGFIKEMSKEELIMKTLEILKLHKHYPHELRNHLKRNLEGMVSNIESVGKSTIPIYIRRHEESLAHDPR